MSFTNFCRKHLNYIQAEHTVNSLDLSLAHRFTTVLTRNSRKTVK